MHWEQIFFFGGGGEEAMWWVFFSMRNGSTKRLFRTKCTFRCLPLCCWWSFLRRWPWCLIDLARFSFFSFSILLDLIRLFCRRFLHIRAYVFFVFSWSLFMFSLFRSQCIFIFLTIYVAGILIWLWSTHL